MWFCLCQLMTNDNPLFPIFTIPLAIAITNFILLKETVEIDYASVFVWYFMPHILAFLLGFNVLMEEDSGGRFCGAHSDANFCGQLLSISLLSSFFLFKRDNGFLRRLLFLTIIVLDAILIFLTGSRGAMLSLVMVMIIMLITSQLKQSIKFLIVLAGAVSVILLINYINSLPDFVLPDESLIDSVLCRFKTDNMEGGGGRLDLWGTAIERLFSGGYFMMPLGHIAATQGSINKYTHNTFLDFLVENGIIIGIIMVIIIISTICVLLKRVSKNKLTLWDSEFVYLCVCSMSQFFFISAITEKTVWVFIIGAIAIRTRASYKKKVHFVDYNQVKQCC